VIVVDASAIVLVLTGSPKEVAAASDALDDWPEWWAPGYLLPEVTSAVRRKLRAGLIDEATAHEAIEDLAEMTVDYVDPRVLLPRVWELRDNVTPYDAGYVAAAEHLDCPLVTADGRLARVPGLRCEVSLIVP
jgi:predicted nucleic acid-binding protein